MPTFTTYAQVERTITELAQIALDNVATQVFEELYNYINEQVYEQQVLRSMKSDIKPTEEFLESLTKDLAVHVGGNVYTAKIHFDPSKMQGHYRRTTKFNSHMNLDGSTSFGGVSVSELMPRWIDEGNGASPHYHYDGIEFMKFISDYIEKNFNALMKKELTRMGMKVR